MTKRSNVALQAIVHNSFIQEIDALKPGNVSRYAAGHDMSYRDFEASANICSPILCRDSLGLGESIFRCVEATKKEVGCNTNLGMLLLFAPIIKAYKTKNKGEIVRSSLKNVLEHLDQNDGKNVYQAIRLAQPGGLGRVEKEDVNFSPNISLLEAMALAAERDMIAHQYVSGFETVFNIGLESLVEFDKRWNSVEWATVACYLSLMVNFPDSHIRRKFGEDVAKQIVNRSKTVYERFINNKNPVEAKPELLEFDKELKDSGINPGTSADLTAASLLIYALR
ncbi:MAG: triphosphoribosyl-dephospho-CoA synthase [Gammaproteobacteria bacterium]|nr:triphosphoribosyl-dephospho-CoA synthase [Gammaproteobacteria bacterium]